MFDTDKYLNVPYKDGGRDLSGWDCWGLVRYVLKHEFNQPDFPAFGLVHPSDKTGMTDKYNQLKHAFVKCKPQAGAIACHFRGRCLIHVGICLDALNVWHTSSKRGSAKLSRKAFERMALTTKYYIYKESL